MSDLRDALRAAASVPAGSIDPERLWRRGRRRRRTRLLLAACTIAVAGGATWSLSGVGPAGSPFERRDVDAAQDPDPVRGDDAPADGPAGSILLASFETDGEPSHATNITFVDLATGESRPVSLPEFASGDAQFKLEPTGDKVVFRGSSGTEPGTYALDRDLEGGPVLLAESWYFVPSATDGRVWLAILDPDSPATVRGLKGVSEITVDGEVTVAQTGPPPSNSIVGAVTSGLVLQDDGLQVWDPRTDEVVARLDGVFPAATRGDLVAWCDMSCPQLHLSDVATGEETAIDPPQGVRFVETYDGAFSPDGRSLALPVRSEEGLQVGVVDLATGSVSVVPGSSLTPYRLIEWSTSGEWVVHESGAGRLSAFHPATGESVTFPLDSAQTYFALAAL